LNGFVSKQCINVKFTLRNRSERHWYRVPKEVTWTSLELVLEQFQRNRALNCTGLRNVSPCRVLILPERLMFVIRPSVSSTIVICTRVDDFGNYVCECTAALQGR